MAALGFIINTFPGISFREMGEVAQRGEELGYERVCTSESLTDTLAIDMWIVSQTSQITVSSDVALISLRHPLIMAQAATTIGDVSGGRFILGIGVGHQPRNEAMGVFMDKPVPAMRKYLGEVRGLLEGERVYPDLPLQTYQGMELAIRQPEQPLRVMMGAVGPRMQELSGEVSDGVYVYLQPVSLMQGIKERVAFSARGAGRDPDAVEVNLMIHTAVDEDLDRARDGARQALTYWLGLPGYNASIAAAGFESEARQIRAAFAEGDQAGIIAGMSDALMDEIAIVGPPGRCMDQIAAIRALGVDLPVLQIDAVSKGESYQEALVRTLAALAPAS